MAQRTVIDTVLDFVLEHYITVEKTDGRKTVRVTRSELSSGAAKTLSQYLTAHGLSEDEAISRLKARFDSVLASQTNAPFGMRQRFDNTRLYTICGAVLIASGAGLFIPGTEKFFFGCLALMGAIVLWMGLDPLPKAMTKFWAEKCQDADGMTLSDLNALHDLVEKTARKGTFDK